MKKLYSFGHFKGFNSQQLMAACVKAGISPIILVDGRDKYILTPSDAKALKEILKKK